MKVWIVSLEWNQPPSEVTGDIGIEGVFAKEGPAQAFASATRLKLEGEGHDVYEFSMSAGRHCGNCGERNEQGHPHACADPSEGNVQFCHYCGAESKDDGTCDNDHDEWDVDVHCTEHEVQA